MTKSIIALVNNRAEIVAVLRKAIIACVFMILGSSAFVLAGADRVIFTFSIFSMLGGLLWLINVLRKIELLSLTNDERLQLSVVTSLICSVSLLLTFVVIRTTEYVRTSPVVEIVPSGTVKPKIKSNNLIETSMERINESTNFVIAATSKVMSAVDKTNDEKYAKAKRDSAYIVAITPIAIRECDKYGIPASIIIAQATLESESGTSELAVKYNNQFGIKEWNKKIAGAMVSSKEGSNLDHYKTSKFRTYSNRWESFRDHSLFLMRDNYKSCRKYKRGEWEKWAYELEACGYAEDSKYSEKLIHLIRKYHLDDIDSI